MRTAKRSGVERLGAKVGARVSLWAVMALAGASAMPAWAQLKPDRAYYLSGRAIPMTVTIPAGASGEAKIQLLEPVTAAVEHSAQVKAGAVDMAQLFPVFWDPPKKAPEGEEKESSDAATAMPKPFYAQLVVGDTKIGPAVFIHPLLNQPVAYLTDPRRWNTVEYAPTPFNYSGVRAWSDVHVLMETNMGEMEFSLRPEQAPNTTWNFLTLVRDGFYQDIVFHRIVNKTPLGNRFAIQGGDPLSNGGGGPGYNIDLEPTTMVFDYGTLGMSRATDPNSAGSQFFIGLSRVGTQFLDGRYAGFGQMVRGDDTIEKITSVEVGDAYEPKADPKPTLVRVRLVPAPPYGEGPKPRPDPKPPAPTPDSAGGNQPASNQPAGNQPAGNQPAGNQPAGNSTPGQAPQGNPPR